MKVLITHLCPTLCNLMDCSPPGSSVHGVLQARILEWVAIPFSNINTRKPKEIPGFKHWIVILVFLNTWNGICFPTVFGSATTSRSI